VIDDNLKTMISLLKFIIHLFIRVYYEIHSFILKFLYHGDCLW
jgi:hypothetical protein